MSEYERTKTNEQSLIGTGLDYTLGPSTFIECRQLEGGFMTQVVNRIDYDVGAPFNRCHHVKESTGIGLPADCASFTTRLLRTVSGLPGPIIGRDPIVEILPSTLTMQRPTLGDIFLEDDADRRTGSRYDAYNRLVHLVKNQGTKPGMNVSQAVMELKDTESTLSQAIDFIRWVKGRINGAPMRIAKGVSKRLRWFSSLADCASAYLWYKFGVEPTITDVQKFRRDISNGRLRVKGSLETKTHVAKKGDVIIERWSTARPLSEIATAMFDMSSDRLGACHDSATVRDYKLLNGESRIGVPLSGPARGWRPAHRVIERHTRGCYFAQVREDIVIDGLADLRRRFGWDSPALTTLWEITPFSFLVDWIVDVGSFIERLEKRYLYEDYSRNLGPLWGTEELREDVYVPSLQQFDVSFSHLRRPTDTSYGGSLNLEWRWSAKPRRLSSRTVFHRDVTEVPSVLWPMLQKKIRAYQISTGMALLAQLGRELVSAK